MVLYPGMTQQAMDASGLSALIATPDAPTLSCEDLGCKHVHGQFKCEFYRRGNTDDEKSRTAVTVGRRNLTAPRWKMLCSGDRICCWQINYTFNRKKAAYVLSAKSLIHAGHSVTPSTTVTTRILSASDVPQAMKDQLIKWVVIPLGGHKLRKVSAYTEYFCVVK